MLKLNMNLERQEFFYIFNDLANKTTVAILIYQDNKIIYANPATSVITGYSHEELIGMLFWELVDDKFKEIVKERGTKRQEGIESHHKYQVLVKRKDGEKRWVLLEGKTTIFRGRPAGLVTAIDIHEKKVLQKQLKYQATLLSILNNLNNKLKDALTESDIMILTKNYLKKHPDIKHILLFLFDDEKRIVNYTTYNARKSIFKNLLNQPIDKMPACFKLLKNKKTVVLKKDNTEDFGICCYLSQRKIGTIIVLKRLEYKNKLIGYISINFNRPNKKLEQFELILLSQIINTVSKSIYEIRQTLALHNLEENFRDFIENNIAGITITTPDGKFIDCNQAFLNLFKYSTKDEILNKEVLTFYKDPKQREFFLNLLKKKKNSKKYGNGLFRQTWQ
ncbi:PAS domain S-box protein [Deferribacter thermophilus]|uniref:PAS domain S-box protein n=1 Tax=Deferribacter thermophilus TaxID=53573 RepID=UPI003C1FB40F